MKIAAPLFALMIGLGSSAGAWALAPAGSTGQCNDGSYTTHDTKKGACAGHKGVKDWFAAGAATATTAAAAGVAPAPKSDAAPAPASTKPATAASAASAAKSTMPTVAAAGGGAGQVWVNSGTKVYHCSGTKYYGKTKQGEYMTEAAAKAAGNHADHGKACTP
jgi:hypothetical protein